MEVQHYDPLSTISLHRLCGSEQELDISELLVQSERGRKSQN